MSEPTFWPWSAYYATAVIVVIAGCWIAERRRPGSARRLALVISLGSAVIYMSWRIAFTIPDNNLAGRIAGIVLVVAELIGLFQLLASTVVGWQRHERRIAPLEALSHFPSVDVFIATYSESLTVLEPTLAGAMSMRYPGRVTVFLCDDGGRPEVRELANRYGARFLEREDHSFAKAGNLNNALAHSDGELVVTLDADMIPTADFLEKTVGFFVDPQLGFAQAPQSFHNQDAFQYNLFSGTVLPNEQDYFMRSLQPGKERFNAVMYIGSNTVFKREALDAIGGFATGVITEDMATGMLLQAEGYTSVFIPDVIAAGLAPESFADLLTQRTRWARGNIQTVRKWNPLTFRGLSAMQRWLYADGVLYWHFGIFKFIFILAPLVYLIAGVSVLDADISSILVFWLPFFLASFVSMRAMSQGRRSFGWTHIYEIAMSPTLAIAVIGEWVGFSTKRFVVTPKGVSSEKLNFRWMIALPHIVVLALCIYGLLHAFIFAAQDYAANSLVVITFWTVYNIVGLTMAVLVCLERPRQRGTERTDVDVAITAQFWSGGAVAGHLRDLSFSGARLSLPWSTTFTPRDASRQRLFATELTLDGIGTMPGVVRWVSESYEGLLVGFEFATLNPTEAIGVVNAITSSPNWVRHDREEKANMASAAARTLSGASRRVSPSLRSEFRLSDRGLGQLHPSGTSATADAPPFSVHVEDLSFGGVRVRSTHRLTSGDTYVLSLDDSRNHTASAQVRWVEKRRGQYIAGLQFDRVAQ